MCLLAPKGRPIAMPGERFLNLDDGADVLNISWSQAYALVRNGELEGIKVGGRGQWRVEREELEGYIARMYDATRKYVAEHPFVEEGADADEAAAPKRS